MKNFLLAALCSGTAFPAMLFERFKPIAPDPSKLEWEDDRTWYHNMKNITTESIRADSQWYSKFLCFVILMQAIGLVLK